MTSTTLKSGLRKNKVEAGLQELTESVPDFDEGDVSLYTNSLQDKQSEQVDSLDDSLCGEEETAEENDCLVPSKEELAQSNNSESIAEQLSNGEKDCSLVDELFDDLPIASQNSNSKDNIQIESFDKKIAPLFTNTKKKKRFRTPVQSITDENNCKLTDKENTMLTCDTKTEKTKPVFSKPNTNPSTGKKRKLSEISKDKVSEPPMKAVKSDTDKQKKSCQPTSNDSEAKEVNFNTKEGTDVVLSNDNFVNKASPTKEVSPGTEKVDKKKKQKKTTKGKENKEATNDSGIKKVMKVNESKKAPNASKKKAAQQQAKIDMSCKNLDREQRKAEKELQKISRELQKAKKQKSKKDKKSLETDQPVSSSNSSSSSGQFWVQCDQPDCLKWRQLRDCKNPSEIPEKWFCSMNPDQKFNSCAVSEEESNDLNDSQEFVYTSYAPGTMVWAKITGYPWWPAIVHYDTNKDTFYEKHPSCQTPIAYHVIFFGKPTSRAWVHSLCLQAFQPDENPNTKVARKYNNSLATALREAEEASQFSVEERLTKYSFDQLYTGHSMFVHDQWAGNNGGKETRKRKYTKKTCKLDSES